MQDENKQREDIEQEKLQSSRDFKEITLAITLLAGILAFLLKLSDYFNNHIINISLDFQLMIYYFVWLLLFEFLLIFLFFIFKGYLVSTKRKHDTLRNISDELFK